MVVNVLPAHLSEPCGGGGWGAGLPSSSFIDLMDLTLNLYIICNTPFFPGLFSFHHSPLSNTRKAPQDIERILRFPGRIPPPKKENKKRIKSFFLAFTED